MRIVVHDYSGHPFQVQLSRELASQGHDVLHLHSESFQTPKGGVRLRADDPPSFAVEGISIHERFSKYGHLALRRRQEIRYGHAAARRIEAFAPEIVISANTPLDAQRIIQASTRARGARFVFWLQDIYSLGIARFLERKYRLLGRLAGRYYRVMERKLLRQSDAVVAITADFVPVLRHWGIKTSRVSVIPNWAPFDELRPCPQDNPWSRSHGLAGKFVFLYSGTIGLKHNPSVLLDLAEAMRPDPDVAVVVISEGAHAGRIREEAAARGLNNMRFMPLQPYELMPEVLSTGSVLLALLDENAGDYSVPSKVLTCLCSNRPLLLSVPARNMAASIVRENDAGLVVSPGDSGAFIEAASRLRHDPELRRRFGINGLAYANVTFDIRSVADRFSKVCGLAPAAEPVLK